MNNELREQFADWLTQFVRDRERLDIERSYALREADDFLAKEPIKTLLEKLEQTREKCPECKGDKGFASTSGGYVTLPGWSPCPTCHGEGSKLHPERLVVLNDRQRHILKTCSGHHL